MGRFDPQTQISGIKKPLNAVSFISTIFKEMVGAVGFEPTTPWSQTRCTTRLCYAPFHLSFSYIAHRAVRCAF